jgi:nucleoid-associated protein YgaU
MSDPLQALLEAGVLETSPFPPNSRYHRVPVATLEQKGEEPIAYLKRRLVPPPEIFSVVQEHSVVQGDRLDNLAARYLGDPELYWRLCDANGAIRPAELTETPGQAIGVSLPEGVPGASGA